jgi:hypothetical protein
VMNEHPCQECKTPSRLDERFCARCGLLFPALAPVEPVTWPLAVRPAQDPIRKRTAPIPRPGGKLPSALRPTHASRRWAPRVLAAFAPVAGAAIALEDVTTGRTADDQVRSVFERQVAAIRSGRFEDAHARFAPDVRRACPIDMWVAGFEPLLEAGGDLSLLDYTDVEIRVSGDEASVSYALRYDGRVVREVREPEPDRYVRIGGRWYDAADPSTACGTGGDGGRSLA